MQDRIEGMAKSNRVILWLMSGQDLAPIDRGGESHGAAIVREEKYQPDDDVVPGGQNFKGEDGKRGTV